ncbi:MAG: hypothetical protein BWK79_06110 [Beggiatoa sp. IS2]|nr:MAG: hypothetical protein BWK79_06110 [Beggiatoa sp. IS2]
MDNISDAIAMTETEKLDQLEIKYKKACRYIKILEKKPIIIPIEQFLCLAEDYTVHQKISQLNIMLPNASKGKEYNYTFIPEQIGLPALKYFELCELKELGLTFDNKTKTITGKPTQSGDFSIKLRYKLTDKEDTYPFLEKNITLLINPDPKDLWQNLPSDKNDKYWKPDCDKLALSLNAGKRIIVASQRGRSHAQEGKFREDDFAVYYHEDLKWSVVVVADGAGSAKYSRQGSFLACNEIIDLFKMLTKEQISSLEEAVINYQKLNSDTTKQELHNLLHQDFLAKAAHNAYRKLAQEANKNETDVKDYATTIVFSILKKFDFGWFIASYGVGDSPMGIYTQNKDPIIMHYPEEGEYSGQTYFLTMPKIFEQSRIAFKIIEDFTAIILMTDGIYDPKFQTRANLDKTQMWANLWQELTEQLNFSLENEALSEKLLEWLDFWSVGNHDDRTIALIF